MKEARNGLTPECLNRAAYSFLNLKKEEENISSRSTDHWYRSNFITGEGFKMTYIFINPCWPSEEMQVFGKVSFKLDLAVLLSL